MITPKEALARILALSDPLSDHETLPLIENLGRYTADTIKAKRTQPAQNLSAMDGYAVRWEDGAGPWRIVGEVAAGHPPMIACGHGEAVRIYTGARLPQAADTVIVQEDTWRNGDALIQTGDGPGFQGAHVRLAGSDFRTGETLIEAGEIITPARIGLAALAGLDTIPVCRKIRVALLSTGDELVPIGAAIGDDNIPASNAVMIAGLCRKTPCEIIDLGIVPDDHEALVRAITTAGPIDILVTTAGASVGDHDLVRAALLETGATLDFWKVAMRPGKPLMAGRLGKTIILGLPGNPVSAFVTATLFLLPLIRHMAGAGDPGTERRRATLSQPLDPNGNRTDFRRAIVADGRVHAIKSDSGMLGHLAMANALIEVPPNVAAMAIGETVTIIPLT